MAYLFKRGSGWYMAYRNGGRWVRESAGTVHKDVARALLRQRELRAASGEEEVKPVPFAKFSQRVLELQRSTLRQKTVARCRAIVNNLTGHESPLYGKMVHEVTEGLVSQYVSHRLSAGAAKSTVLKELTWLKMTLTEAARQGYILRAAVAIVREEISPKRLPSLRNANRRRRRVLLPHEIPILYQVVGENQNLRDAVLLAFRHGLRAGNILELREEQLDFHCDPAVIRFRPGETKNEEPLLILLSPEAREILWRRWQGIPGRRLFQDFRPAWKRAMKRAGLKDFRFHDLRHSYITYRLAAAIDPKTVQDEVGHRDSRMTMDCYGKALKDPAVRIWALRNFRFPWDPAMVSLPIGTTHLATQSAGSKGEERISP